MILAAATPSMSKSARSAPKIRSTLSTLLGQSSGKRLVTAFTKRRFASAAVVSSEASQNHTAIISTNAPISATALKTPRPTRVAMSIVLPSTFRERQNRRLHCLWPTSRSARHDIVIGGERCYRLEQYENPKLTHIPKAPRVFSLPRGRLLERGAPSGRVR